MTGKFLQASFKVLMRNFEMVICIGGFIFCMVVYDTSFMYNNAILNYFGRAFFLFKNKFSYCDNFI